MRNVSNEAARPCLLYSLLFSFCSLIFEIICLMVYTAEKGGFMQFCFIYITAGSEAEAGKIAKTLVEEKLVACVNMHPVHSIYRWKGKVEEEAEVAMLVKTRAELVERVSKRVKELHSYEVPCILVLNIEKGNPEYLKWIEESTGGEE